MSEEEQKYFKGLIGFTFDSDDIKYIEKIVDKKDKEIERLNNIINELERKLLSTYSTYVSMDKVPEIAKYIRELKGSE